jgi:hypothetical protein
MKYEDVLNSMAGQQGGNAPPARQGGFHYEDATRLVQGDIAPENNSRFGGYDRLSPIDYIKLGAVDTGQGQLRVIADAMGVDPKYVGRVGDKIQYFDPETRQVRIVDTDGLAQKGYEFFGNLVGKLPTAVGSVVGGVLGTAGGPAGTVAGGIAGAGLGEAGRQLIGSTMEDKTASHVLGEVGKEMAWEAPFAGAAGVGMRAARNKLVHELQQDAGRLNHAAMRELSEAEARHGVPLTVAERTGLPSMLNEQIRLANKPGSGDVLRPWLDERGKKVFDAIERYADAYSDVGSVYDANKATKSAFAGTIGDMKAARTKAASPLYEKAFKEAGAVDVTPVMRSISEELPKLAGRHEKRMQDVLGMLGGKSEGGMMPLETLDNVKKAIDDMIGTARKDENMHLVSRLTGVKNNLVNLADEASPSYKQARETWRTYEDKASGFNVNDLSEGMVGEIADKSMREREADAINMLFGKNSSPEIVLKARLTVGRENPEAWNAMIKGYLLDNLYSIKATSGHATHPNVGGMFFKRTLGDPQQKAMLKTAMTPEQFATFEEIGKLLELTGKAAGKESGTHWLMAMDARAKNQAPKGAVARTARIAEGLNPLSWENKADRAIQGLEASKVTDFERALAEALVRPDGLSKIRYLQILTPSEQRLRAGVTMFINDMLGASGSTATGSSYSDVPLRDPAKWQQYSGQQ